jgi:hypothetical protein
MKNGKIFYEFQNQKLCPRCSLEHLSYYITQHSNKEIQFYMTDILFDQMKKNDSENIKFCTKEKWMEINQCVNKNLKQVKNRMENIIQNEKHFNLIILVNEILMNQFKKYNVLYMRNCQICCKQNFHLIIIPCCKQYFICIECLAKSQQCSNKKCKNTNLCTAGKEFEKILYAICKSQLEKYDPQMTEIKERFLNTKIQDLQQFYQKQYGKFIKYSQFQKIVTIMIFSHTEGKMNTWWKTENMQFYITNLLWWLIAIMSTCYQITILGNSMGLFLMKILCYYFVHEKNKLLNKLKVKNQQQEKLSQIELLIQNLSVEIASWMNFLVFTYYYKNGPIDLFFIFIIAYSLLLSHCVSETCQRGYQFYVRDNSKYSFQ